MRFENITRINNSVYQLKLESDERITIHVDPKCFNTSKYADRSRMLGTLFTNITDAQFSQLIANNQKSFSIEGKKFVIERENSKSFASRVTNFIQKGNFSGIVKLKVTPAPLLTSSDSNIGNFRLGSASFLTNDPLFRADPKAMTFFEMNQIHHDCYYEGIYSDPFTKLAAHAFQNYHPDYAQRSVNEDFEPIIITKDRSSIYALAHETDYRSDYFLSHSEVVSDFYRTLVLRWGEEKVKLAQFRYGINLEVMIEQNQPLTVDIVYKMNIGIGTWTTHDLERGRKGLSALKMELLELPGDMPLLVALNTSQQPLALKKGFFNSQNSSDATVADALAWFNANAFIDSKIACTKLSHQEVSLLMQIMQPNSDEQLQKYTGRKIGDFIDSEPTLATVKVFKPWVDDQEISESCDTLINNTSWEYFNQQLAYAICKKHLVHTHPEHVFQVGTLIPAPKITDGVQEWYRVSALINSGTGNFSYTLEPLSADSALPIIKLFRSTASGQYAFDSHASIKTDLNPLNPPGYEGHLLVEPYEKDLFHQRTIPIWVGYHYHAFEKMQQIDIEALDYPENDLKKIADLLEKSTVTLLEDERNKNRMLDTKELLRRYDWIVLNVLQDCFRGSETHRKLPLIDSMKLIKIINKYSHKMNEEPIPLEEQREDAAFIASILNRNPTNQSEMLSNLLHDHMISPQDMIPNDSMDHPLIEQISSSLALYQSMKTEQASPQELFELIRNWSQSLSILSKERGESPEQKIHQKILCVGHSLGGALAQRTLAKYTLLSNRMPIPGQGIELFDFCAPGINSDDNNDFIATGNKHADFFFELKRPFITINRRQTAGDFISLGGVTHLGSTFSDEDTINTLKWLDFDGRVQKPTKRSKHPGVTSTSFTHGIQPAVPSYVAESSSGVTSVPFDTAVQADFDRRVSAVTKDLWKIDGSFASLLNFNQSSPFLRAVLRTDLLGKHPAPNRTSHALYGPWLENRTEEGVFVVSEG